MGRPRPRRPKKSNLRDLSKIVEEVRLPVYRDSDGARLDQFLADQLPWRSKTAIQGWIQDGQVEVAGRGRVKKSLKLRFGDVVSIAVPAPTVEVRHEAIAEALEVLYEDDDLIAIDKPAGLVCHPVGRIRYNTLIQALHWRYRHGPERDTRRERPVIPKICHRLDKDTSGVIIVAKNDDARRQIQEIFEARDLDKRYETLVVGQLERSEQRVDAPLGPDLESGHGMKMAVREDGLPSRSDVRLRESYTAGDVEASLCEVRIFTGRQHQIRVHMAHLGHPVLCDTLYGRGEGAVVAADGERILTRQALHAARLVLPHPRTGAAIELRAALPDDLSALRARLAAGEALSLEVASEPDARDPSPEGGAAELPELGG